MLSVFFVAFKGCWRDICFDMFIVSRQQQCWSVEVASLSRIYMQTIINSYLNGSLQIVIVTES